MENDIRRLYRQYDPATPLMPGDRRYVPCDQVRGEGDLIAQLVVQPVVTATFIEVDRLPPSPRGAGGHGSTGGINGWLEATEPTKEQA